MLPCPRTGGGASSTLFLAVARATSHPRCSVTTPRPELGCLPWVASDVQADWRPCHQADKRTDEFCSTLDRQGGSVDRRVRLGYKVLSKY